jgi:hypothetical protein
MPTSEDPFCDMILQIADLTDKSIRWGEPRRSIDLPRF